MGSIYWIALLGISMAAGCTKDRERGLTDGGEVGCTPGVVDFCDCPETGTRGQRTCDEAGEDFGPCECPACSPGCCTVSRFPPEPNYDSCTMNDFCLCAIADDYCDEGGTCTDAFSTSWRLYPLIAVLPAKDPSGNDWDASTSCPGPDAYYTLSVNGTLVANELAMTSSTLLDCVPRTFDPRQTYQAFWEFEDLGSTYDVMFSSGDDLLISIYDADGDPTTDPVVSSCAISVTAEVLRGRQLRCEEADGSSITVVISPQP